MSCGKCHPHREIGHSGMSKHWWINIWSPSLPPWRCKPSLAGRLNVSVRTLAQKIGLEGSKQLPYQVRIQYSHRPHQDLPEALRWRWGQWLSVLGLLRSWGHPAPRGSPVCTGARPGGFSGVADVRSFSPTSF